MTKSENYITVSGIIHYYLTKSDEPYRGGKLSLTRIHSQNIYPAFQRILESSPEFLKKSLIGINRSRVLFSKFSLKFPWGRET